MKFYIATGLERAEEAKQVAAHLSGLGHESTYAWWEHGSVQAEGPARIAEVAANEVQGVRTSDLFVGLLPGARGTHTEFGIALLSALVLDESPRYRVANHEYREPVRKTIVLIGPTEDATGRTCAFYLHPRVDERFATLAEFLAWFKGWSRVHQFGNAS